MILTDPNKFKVAPKGKTLYVRFYDCNSDKQKQKSVGRDSVVANRIKKELVQRDKSFHGEKRTKAE